MTRRFHRFSPDLPGLLEKPLKGKLHQGNPPYPPCQGGKKSDARPTRRGFYFSWPPDKGLLKNPMEEEVMPAPPPGFRFRPSFRRKPESIFAFAFSPPCSDVFAPERGGAESNTKTKGKFSGFRIRTPRENKAVAAPPGEKSKWIPAFAGMTAVVNSDQG